MPEENKSKWATWQKIYLIVGILLCLGVVAGIAKQFIDEAIKVAYKQGVTDGATETLQAIVVASEKGVVELKKDGTLVVRLYPESSIKKFLETQTTSPTSTQP